jgi:predicted RNA-binding Zn-ribbon protein involved in translation (DUF1610 family)
MSPKPTSASAWSPPKTFVPVPSAVPGIEVYAPKPKEAHKDEAMEYECPNCGSAIAYDVSAGGVACEYCGYTAPVQSVHLGRTAAEFEFTLETVSQSERGWGEKRQVLHCDSCGAELSIPKGALTSTCPYCASNQVNVTTCTDENLRPRFLVPFKITGEQSQGLVRDWLGKGWFHPKELSTNTVLARLSGLYLPFWTFDTRIQANWRAQVGYEKTVRHYNASQKRWENRTKIVWRWEEGAVSYDIDDFLITGSAPQRISHRILKRTYPYDMRGLMAYDPGYLAGWQAQAYETTLTDAWESGKNIMREDARKACVNDIPTQRFRNFSMQVDFGDESWRYILLPIYLAAYRFEGETYQVMVNGQTGTIAGQKPVAWWKIWLAVTAALAPGTLLGLIGALLTFLAGAGIILLALGVILFVIGVIFSFNLVRQARESEAE